MEIILCINGQQLEAHYPKLYSGSVGVLYVKFAEADFDSTLIKAVRFKTAQSNWYTADITDGAVKVPHEVIVPGGFDIALAGYEEKDGTLTKFLPTGSVHIDVSENGYGEPDAPLENETDPASYVAQVERLMSETAETAEAAKSTAESALTGLDNKANAADVYTKEQADSLLDAKVDKASGKGLSAVADITLFELSETIINGGQVTEIELPINKMVIKRENGAKDEIDCVTSEHRDCFDHPNNSVTSIKIADKAVTSDKLGDDVTAEIRKKADAETAEGTLIRTGTLFGEAGTVSDAAKLASEANKRSLENKAELETKADMEFVKGMLPKAAVSGNPAIITDHLCGMSLIDYKIYGNSYQETRIGKNLLPYPHTDTAKTVNGITFTDNGDGTITANGTATGEARYTLGNDIAINNTAVISGCPANGSATTYLIQIVQTENGTDKYYADTGNGKAMTYTALKTVYIVIKSGTTVSNLVFKPQIEEGTVATPYEPYGVSPSPEFPSEIKSVGELVTNGEYAGKYEISIKLRTADNTVRVYKIYAAEPLRKVSDHADYVDFAGQRIVRMVEVLDNTNTTTIDKSFGVLETPVTEPVEAPSVVIPQSDTVHISTATEIAGKLEITYFQDIGKKLAEIQAEIAAI